MAKGKAEPRAKRNQGRSGESVARHDNVLGVAQGEDHAHRRERLRAQMPIEANASVLPPPPDESKIWRYMDLPKFLSIIEYRALWFAAASRLGDPFEGSSPRANLVARPIWYGEQLASAMNEKGPENARFFLDRMFVSCWHASEDESAALWAQYASRGGIAIQSTVGRLKAAIKTDRYIVLGSVCYVDYDSEEISNALKDGNFYPPFFHKRRSFKHEQEVRAALMWDDDPYGELGPPPLGFAQPVEPETLIEAVYLEPGAQTWLSDLVRRLLRRYDLGVEVFPSDLDRKPLY